MLRSLLNSIGLRRRGIRSLGWWRRNWARFWWVSEGKDGWHELVRVFLWFIANFYIYCNYQSYNSSSFIIIYARFTHLTLLALGLNM
jgi:hypothetical protein